MEPMKVLSLGWGVQSFENQLVEPSDTDATGWLKAH